MEPDLPKFLQLRDVIRDQILAGVYGDNAPLPSEAELCRDHDVSRVTVRKALDELKRERIVTGIKGSGTFVTLGRRAFQGALDMVVLVAPIYDRFFSTFFAEFESAVDKNGTIVIFKQDTARAQMGSAAFYSRFLARGIRDFVLWPSRGFDGNDLLPRLRGLGVNVVLFDHLMKTDAADCVGLDNRHAVSTLHGELRAQGCRRIDFIGWDDVPLSTTRDRESAFRDLAGPRARVFHVSKLGGNGYRKKIAAIAADLARARDLPDAFLCLNGDIGSALSAALAQAPAQPSRVACIDEIPPVPGVPITCLVQPVQKMAERAFQCLVDQNRLGKRWTAKTYTVKGALSTPGTRTER